MAKKPDLHRSSTIKGLLKWTPVWFRISVFILLILITVKILGLQVFIEVSFEGKPFLAALTEIETYIVPLLLLLLYILSVWIWKKIFGRRDV